MASAQHPLGCPQVARNQWTGIWGASREQTCLGCRTLGGVGVGAAKQRSHLQVALSASHMQRRLSLPQNEHHKLTVINNHASHLLSSH
eukprot:1725100-Rhodomonas_salina.1